MVKGAALKGNMPMYKYVGNKVLTWIENTLAGTRLTEFHSGYRAYSVHALRKIPLGRMTYNWHFDTQIILQFLKAGYRIKEVPIPTYYGDEICHVNGILYAMHCAWEALKHAVLHRWNAPRPNHNTNDAGNARNGRDDRGPRGHSLPRSQRPQEQPPANLQAGAGTAT